MITVNKRSHHYALEKFAPPSAAHKWQAKRAFTLIELLVIISIIALLAAILFPVFSRVRENARKASCQSNMRQIGLALSQYLNDYDDVFPLYLYESSYNGVLQAGEKGWATVLQPYCKSTQLFQCPSELTKANTNPLADNVTAPFAGQGAYTDYVLNAVIGGYRGTTVARVPLRGSQLVASSHTVFAAEFRTGDASTALTGGTGASASCYGDSSTAGGSPGLVGNLQVGQPFHNGAIVHHGGSNFLFADCHVKWIRPEAVYNWCSNPSNYKVTYAYK